MIVTVIRVDGTEEQHAIGRVAAFPAIARLIDARTLDIVNLRDGRTMLVDEDGYDVDLVERTPPAGFAFAFERVPVRARKAPNPAATAIYHAVSHVFRED